MSQDNDPLAPYRREPRPIASEPEQKPLTERQALKLAIRALNEVPNSGVRMEGYTNTYKLIGVNPTIEPPGAK